MSQGAMADALRNGRYVIRGLLGEGSQGQTLDAIDMREGRPVAIKRFDVRGARGWKDVELAEREARVLQSLSHPLLPLYVEHFEEGSSLYLVMERIEGESLAAIRRRGGVFGVDDASRLLRDAASALDYLHRRSPPVVHRDLKPGNVIRRPDGSFAFVDFGAVRDKLRPEGGSTIVGTFGYMAPEQFQGRAQPSSDLYAVGATALAMLTGKEPEALPHKGLAIDVRAALRASGQDASGPLAGVLEQLLDTDPDRRPSTLGPLLSRLAGTRAGRGRVAREGCGSSDAYDFHELSMMGDEGRRAARRARRAARRAMRRAAHARRHAGYEGPPLLLVALMFSVASFAVLLATQVVVPAVLFFLWRVLRIPVRGAIDEVRHAGREGLANLRQSREWFVAQARERDLAAAGAAQPRVAFEPSSAGIGRARVGEAEGDDTDADNETARRQGR